MLEDNNLKTMWQSQTLKDVLPLIEGKLNRRGSLNMIQVCKFWRHILKDKVSDKYPIVINSVEDDKYSKLSWTTVICNAIPCPKFAKVKKLILAKKIDTLDWDKLPKGLKMLSINISDNFVSIGAASQVSHIGIRGNFSYADVIPYNILTPDVTKLEICGGTSSEYPVDFRRLNIAKYTSLYIKPTNRADGHIPYLTLSYKTLTKLVINMEIMTDLRCFENLKELNIICEEMDISYLPLKIENLKMQSEYVLNFSDLKSYEKIIHYTVGLTNNTKILFPPNVKNVKIKCFNPIDRIPQSVTEFSCCVKHLDMVYYSSNIQVLKLGVKFLKGVKFSCFTSPLKRIEMGKVVITEDMFPDKMNVVSMKLYSDSINLEHLPSDLQVLYVKRQAKISGVKKRASLKIFVFAK